jgi:hypothetical protein
MVSSSKRIEVIADDEEEIIEAARRMVDKYDWVVTSGGIGELLVHFCEMLEGVMKFVEWLWRE